MFRKLTPILLFFLIYAATAFAQTRVIDSLKTELQNATQDTARLRLYIELAGASDVSNNLLYALPAEQLADKLLSQTTNDSARNKILMLKASAYEAMSFHYSQGNDADMNKVDEYGEKAIEILEQIKDTASIIGVYQGLSRWNLSQGNFPKALEYIQVALSKSQKLNYKPGTGLCYAVIADMYRDQGENAQALTNYENALAALSGTKDTDDLRNVLAAMGGFYYKIHNMDKSLEYYRKVISIYEEQKQNDKIGLVYQWIGDAYSFNKDYDSALVNYEKCLMLLEPTDRKDKMRQVNDAIGTVYFKQGNFDKAIDFHLQALQVG